MEVAQVVATAVVLAVAMAVVLVVAMAVVPVGAMAVVLVGAMAAALAVVATTKVSTRMKTITAARSSAVDFVPRVAAMKCANRDLTS